MREQPLHRERSAATQLLQALVFVTFAVLSAAALVLIGNKVRVTWGVLETLEQRVDGMIAARHPDTRSAGASDPDLSRVA